MALVRRFCVRRRNRNIRYALFTLVVFATFVFFTGTLQVIEEVQTTSLNTSKAPTTSSTTSTETTTTFQRNLRRRRKRRKNLPPPTKIEPLSPEEVEKAEAEMRQRVDTMRRVCTEIPVEESLNPWEYFVVKRQPKNLVWCNVFKSASSSWLYVLNQLSGHATNFLDGSREPPVTIARKAFPRPTLREVTEAVKDAAVVLVVARHPLERLKSAYRDKIVGALRGSLHDKLNGKIVAKYRNVTVKQDDISPGERREKFIQSIVGGGKKRGKKFPAPTFSEFVRFILDEAALNGPLALDMHWTPVNDFCQPCKLNFTHIVKMETFSRDERLVLQTLGIADSVFVRRENESTNKAEKNDVDFTLDDPNLIKGLCRLYKADFEIFGFDLPEIC